MLEPLPTLHMVPRSRFVAARLHVRALTIRLSQTVVFVNLPQDDRFVNAAQFLYSIAILLSTPLQLFPAVRIMENGVFSRSGKHSNKVKWEKNLFRMAVVVACSGIAWAGASDLDKFVSLIGSVAWYVLLPVASSPRLTSVGSACRCASATVRSELIGILRFADSPFLSQPPCSTTRPAPSLADRRSPTELFSSLESSRQSTRLRRRHVPLRASLQSSADAFTTSQIKLLASGESSSPPTFGKCPPHV